MYLKKVASKSMERWKAGKVRMCLEGFHMWGNEGGGHAGPVEKAMTTQIIYFVCVLFLFFVLLWSCFGW